MWDFYFKSFCAALASLTASLVYRTVVGTSSEKRRLFGALFLGAVSGTLVLIVGTALPHRVQAIRLLMLPSTAIEGDWMQVHGDQENKYSTVHLKYDPTTRCFMVSGQSARVSSDSDGKKVIASRAVWNSTSMGVEQTATGFAVHYTFDARIIEKGQKLENLNGFGQFNFTCRNGLVCNHGSGFYKDIQLKPPVNFKLHRLCGDKETLSLDDDEVIMLYAQSPDRFRCEKVGAPTPKAARLFPAFRLAEGAQVGGLAGQLAACANIRFAYILRKIRKFRIHESGPSSTAVFWYNRQ
jgi:hypothetical protein